MNRLTIASTKGLSAEDLKEAYASLALDPQWTHSIIDHLAETSEVHKEATWLLKHHVDAGERLEDHLVDAVYRSTSTLEHWEALLHILQSMSGLPISSSNYAFVDDFVHRCLEHENKFVRAWAFHGLDLLSTHNPAHRLEFNKRIKAAMENEAPSVKARIRQLIK